MKLSAVLLFCAASVAQELNVRTLVFQIESSQDFVELEPLKPLDLSSFTLCLRVATELPRRQREIILFAYRTFCLVKPRVSSLLRIGLYLRSSSEGALFTVPALGPMQTHLCVTWDSGTGATTAFVDGKKSLTKFYGKGHTVNSGGKVIIGQDPDEYLGSFEASQSFVGEISDINLWSSVLPHSVIQQMATRLSSTQPGDIIDWKEVKMQVTGDVKLITTNVLTQGKTNCDFSANSFHSLFSVHVYHGSHLTDCLFSCRKNKMICLKSRVNVLLWSGGGLLSPNAVIEFHMQQCYMRVFSCHITQIHLSR
uniref:Pentraxin (PTX) domain-containing protein n=1 Tax=Neogobius melanostomus TaxID=47308 RepID=A0A8C6S8V7_9GOBI